MKHDASQQRHSWTWPAAVGVLAVVSLTTVFVVLPMADWRPRPSDLKVLEQTSTLARREGPSVDYDYEEYWDWTWEMNVVLKNRYRETLQLDIYQESFWEGEYHRPSNPTEQVEIPARGTARMTLSLSSTTKGRVPTIPDGQYRFVALATLKHRLEYRTFEWILVEGNINESTIIFPLTIYQASCPPRGGGVLTVGPPETGSAYESVQAAVNAATPGDKVVVCGGRYQENVRLNKSLRLEGIGSPLIDAQGSGNALVVEADGCTIQGFRFYLSGRDRSGVYVSASQARITNCTTLHNGAGIMLVGSDSCLIDRIFSRGDYVGVDASTSSGVTIRDSSFEAKDCGVRLKGCRNFSLVSNYVKDSYVGFKIESSPRCIITGNRMSSDRGSNGIEANMSQDFEANSNDISMFDYGIRMDHSSRALLANNTIWGDDRGIVLFYVDSFLIRENQVMGGHEGIMMVYGNDVEISHNNLSHGWSFDISISVSSSHNCTIANNDSRIGTFEIGYSEQIRIVDNIIRTNIRGIKLTDCVNCYSEGNKIIPPG